MPNEGRLRSWQRTRTHLAAAAALLPASPRKNPDGGSLQRYDEVLEHNELELALDELEGLAEVNAVPPAFWTALAEAASEMKLPITRRQRIGRFDPCAEDSPSGATQPRSAADDEPRPTPPRDQGPSRADPGRA